MKKSVKIILLLLLLFNTAVSIRTISQKQPSVIHYSLFVGTDDNDTNLPVMSIEEAEEIVTNVLIKHVGNYSIIPVKGGWIDDKGTQIKEDSILCLIDNVDPKVVYEIADELKQLLKQNTILIQTYKTDIEYYEGGK